MKNILFYFAAGFIKSSFFWYFAAALSKLPAMLKRSVKLLVLHGYTLEQNGRINDAVKIYKSAVSIAEISKKTTDSRWLHAGQYFLEKGLYKLGKSRVEDPLFECCLHGKSPETYKKRNRPGFFKGEFGFSGLLIIGFLPPDGGSIIEIFLDGIKIREAAVSDRTFFKQFSIKILRNVLMEFPTESELKICVKGGGFLSLPDNSEGLKVNIPSGTGELIKHLGNGRVITKKGDLSLSSAELKKRQDLYLALYNRARNFFDKQIDKSLFLMHGTLLGYYREGEFIKGDDDFDVAYMSASNNPYEVKKEALGIISDLLDEGFSVSFNRKGRLFRIYEESTKDRSIHLDVHTIWIEDGYVWAPLDYSVPGSKTDFIPVLEGRFRNIKIYYPSKTELFLSNHYGSDWKIPDPGFNNYTLRMDAGIKRNFSKLYITPDEYRYFIDTLKKKVQQNQIKGKFLSIGAGSLYPLSGYETDFE